MKTNPRHYRRHRFPPEIISQGVWLYRRFCLSFRDVEDLLASSEPGGSSLEPPGLYCQVRLVLRPIVLD